MKQATVTPLRVILGIALFLLVPLFLSAQVRPICGASPAKKAIDLSGYEGMLFYDRFGNIYTEDELTKPWKKVKQQKMLTGDFFVLFTGFTASEEETIRAAFEYVSSFIGIGAQGLPPRIEVKKTPLNYPLLGQGTSFFYGNGECGFNDNFTLQVLISGQGLDFPPPMTAGRLEINSLVNWHTIDNDPIVPGLYDLFSVSVHEILHVLGFSSLIGVGGDPILNYYSRWDRFLWSDNLAEHLIVDGGTPFPGCCGSAEANPNLVFPDEVASACSDEVHFRSTANIAQVFGNYGSLPDEDSEMANTLSHLNRCGAGGDPYVMNATLAAGVTQRVMQAEEIEILYALGYPKETNAEVCHVMATDDFYNLNWGNEIPYDLLLANDVVPPGVEAEVVVQGCGNLLYQADVSLTPTGILIENAPIGRYYLCYGVKGCDGLCDMAYIRVLNLPPLPPCPACETEELFCYGDFEDFLPIVGNGIDAQLGLPHCNNDNGWQTTHDIYVDSDGGKMAVIWGTNSEYNLEYLSVPLSSPVLPGCKVEICFEAAANYCFEAPVLSVYGTSLPACSGQWDPACNQSGPFYCLGNAPLSECQSVNWTEIECGHPYYPEEYPCNAHIDVRALDGPLAMEEFCLVAENTTNEPWSHIVISFDPEGSTGQVFLDNLSILSDCCLEPDSCGVEIVETCKENSVILTVLQNGHVIPMYNAPCCVSWSGIGGIPTIECPPKPGLPSQNFNNIHVAYGETYSVEVVCGDCVFTYSGVAGETCGDSGTGGSQGVAATEPGRSLLLAPNPTHGAIEASGKVVSTSRSWEVVGLQGRALSGEVGTADERVLIPTAGLPAGLYLLLLRDDQGQVVEAARFVKE